MESLLFLFSFLLHGQNLKPRCVFFGQVRPRKLASTMGKRVGYTSDRCNRHLCVEGPSTLEVDEDEVF